MKRMAKARKQNSEKQNAKQTYTFTFLGISRFTNGRGTESGLQFIIIIIFIS